MGVSQHQAKYNEIGCTWYIVQRINIFQQSRKPYTTVRSIHPTRHKLTKKEDNTMELCSQAECYTDLSAMFFFRSSPTLLVQLRFVSIASLARVSATLLCSR
mmetsp:Transcript_8370/g.12101  ORF Transcript_8370/g.12101 Transcript_8370/m.12101 type:complete len:102 (+) Transcript_8370:3120-3425(+)